MFITLFFVLNNVSERQQHKIPFKKSKTILLLPRIVIISISFIINAGD